MSYLESLEDSFISSDLSTKSNDEEKQARLKRDLELVEEELRANAQEEKKEVQVPPSMRGSDIDFNLSAMIEEEVSKPKEKDTTALFDSFEDSLYTSDLKSVPETTASEVIVSDNDNNAKEAEVESETKKIEQEIPQYLDSLTSPFLAAAKKKEEQTEQKIQEEKQRLKTKASSFLGLFGKTNEKEKEEIDPKEAWAKEDALSIEERRQRYHCIKYVELKDIKNWSYVAKKLHPEETKQEKESKFSINEEINKKITLWHGDITTLEIDAIVNAANESCLGGGGIDGAIHRAAGDRLYEECRTLHGCLTGQTKITRGYDLPAKYVLHTVGPKNGDAAVLESSYSTCLQLIAKHNIRSVAFCCIATGIYGFPLYPATRIALETVRKWLEKDNNKDKVDLIIFCTFLPKEKACYEELLPEYFPIQRERRKSVDPESVVQQDRRKSVDPESVVQQDRRKSVDPNAQPEPVKVEPKKEDRSELTKSREKLLVDNKVKEQQEEQKRLEQEKKQQEENARKLQEEQEKREQERKQKELEAKQKAEEQKRITEELQRQQEEKERKEARKRIKAEAEQKIQSQKDKQKDLILEREKQIREKLQQDKSKPDIERLKSLSRPPTKSTDVTTSKIEALEQPKEHSKEQPKEHSKEQQNGNANRKPKTEIKPKHSTHVQLETFLQ